MGEHLIKESSANARAFNPGSVLFSVIHELQPLIDKQNIEIDYEVDGLKGDVIGFEEIIRLIITDFLVVLMSAMEGSKVDVLLARVYCASGTLVFMAEDSRRVIVEERKAEILFGETKPNLTRAETLLKRFGGLEAQKSLARP